MKSIQFFLIGAALLLASCSESIQLGADLLEDGNIEINYTDTFVVRGKTVPSSAPPTYRNSSTFNGRTYLVGSFTHPAFGRSTSTSFFSTSLLAPFPDFSDARFDSVILALPLDTLGLYGDESEVHNINLHQLTDVFVVDPGDTLFSDMPLAYDEPPLSSISQAINARDSIKVFNPQRDTIVDVIPQLRFRMDTSFWSAVARDTLNNESSEALRNYVRGFALVSENADNSMFGVNLQNDSPAAVEVYYTVGDTAQEIYFLNIAAFRHQYFEHDYSGSSIEPVLNTEGNDERLYLQSMGGTNVELDLSFIADLPDEILNKATIEITLEAREENYPPINQILASHYNSAGKLTVIEDALTSFISRLFGGSLEQEIKDGVLRDKYEINITSHVNNIINGEIEDTRLVISGLAKSERPNQSLLLGPTHPDYPVLVKIITTKP